MNHSALKVVLYTDENPDGAGCVKSRFLGLWCTLTNRESVRVGDADKVQKPVYGFR